MIFMIGLQDSPKAHPNLPELKEMKINTDHQDGENEVSLKKNEVKE